MEALEIANMVRSGAMKREAGLAKIETPECVEIVNYAKEGLML